MTLCFFHHCTFSYCRISFQFFPYISVCECECAFVCMSLCMYVNLSRCVSMIMWLHISLSAYKGFCTSLYVHVCVCVCVRARVFRELPLYMTQLVVHVRTSENAFSLVPLHAAPRLCIFLSLSPTLSVCICMCVCVCVCVCVECCLWMETCTPSVLIINRDTKAL